MTGYFRACDQSMSGAFLGMLSVFLWAGVSFMLSPIFSVAGNWLGG